VTFKVVVDKKSSDKARIQVGVWDTTCSGSSNVA